MPIRNRRAEFDKRPRVHDLAPGPDWEPRPIAVRLGRNVAPIVCLYKAGVRHGVPSSTHCSVLLVGGHIFCPASLAVRKKGEPLLDEWAVLAACRSGIKHGHRVFIPARRASKAAERGGAEVYDGNRRDARPTNMSEIDGLVIVSR